MALEVSQTFTGTNGTNMPFSSNDRKISFKQKYLRRFPIDLSQLNEVNQKN